MVEKDIAPLAPNNFGLPPGVRLVARWVSRKIFQGLRGVSASPFPRSRNRGRNRGISYLKWNFQCETENAFLLKAPYLSFASPPDKNHTFEGPG